MHVIKRYFECEEQSAFDLIRLLRKRGANPNIQNDAGKNAFDLIEEAEERKNDPLQKRKVRKLLDPPVH